METLKRVMSVSLSERDIPKRPRLATAQDSDSDSDNSFSRKGRSRHGSSSCETIYSIQQRDTDRIGSSSDTNIDSDATEYEVAHLSPDAPNPFFSSNDSDELNEINEIAELGAVVAAVSYNSGNSDIEVGILADTSEEVSTSPTSNSDVDPELPRQDYLDFWTCAQCNAVNENRHVPFCDKCYLMRKNFFPPRPGTRKRSRRRRFIIDSGVSGCSQPSTSGYGLIAISQASTSEPGGLTASSQASTSGLSASSQTSILGPDVMGIKESESGVQIISQEATADVDVVDGPGTSQKDSSLCDICFERPKNGLFAHGFSAHLYSCYQCAKKIWRQSGRCPLCRKKIDRVIRLLQ